MLASHDRGDALDDLQAPGGHVVLFTDIGRQVVQLYLQVPLMQVAPQTFPIAQSHGLQRTINGARKPES
jgi:hypothetical protein